MQPRSHQGLRGRGVRGGLLLALAAGLSLVAVPTFANHVGSISGEFESADGDLAVDVGHDAIDWNSFVTPAGATTEEQETFAELRDDWNLARFPDAIGNPDDIFAGGVKQDDVCPSTKIGSNGGGNSKFDVSDVYLANKQIGGDEFLFIAWVRVPSSPTASSHIAYEFNKGTDGTCTDSDLLKRVEGDMLIVYDFEGGDADSQVKLARWLATGESHSADDCEVAKALPCWGDVQVLTAQTPPVADAKVNNPTDVGTVYDAHRDEDLAPVRFGEAGINLTDAGVIDPTVCESFGHVTVASRSSGNSGIAQMKDKLGPEEFQIGSCGALKIVKEDTNQNPLGGALFDVYKDGGDEIFGDPDGEGTEEPDDEFIGSCDTTVYTDDDPPVPAADELQDGTGNCVFEDLFFGQYWVEETQAPTGYTGEDPKLVDVLTTAQVTVTFVNTPEPGRITVQKADDEGTPLSGVVFELWNDDDADGVWDDDDPAVDEETEDDDTDTGLTCTTDASGVCQGGDTIDIAFDQVPPGFYCVVEDTTTTPTGYDSADPQCFEVELTSGGDDVSLTFVNPRLHRVIVIVCHEGTDTLYPSTVNLDDGTTAGDEKSSLATAPTGIDEGDLCALGGAQYDGLEHGTEDLSVAIPDPHPAE